MLRRICRAKMEEAIGSRTEQHEEEEVHDLYSSSGIIIKMISERMRWEENII
jgi:hypothetical protein